jgi:hypothetical protein
MFSQGSAYSTDFASSMADAAPDGVCECLLAPVCIDGLNENSNFAATKAVEIPGPRSNHALHEEWGAEGGGASTNSPSFPISGGATALTKQTAKTTATALATGVWVHCTGPSFTKCFESDLNTSNFNVFSQYKHEEMGAFCNELASLDIVYRVSRRGGLNHKEKKVTLARAHLERRWDEEDKGQRWRSICT